MVWYKQSLYLYIRFSVFDSPFILAVTGKTSNENCL